MWETVYSVGSTTASTINIRLRARIKGLRKNWPLALIKIIIILTITSLAETLKRCDQVCACYWDRPHLLQVLHPLHPPCSCIIISIVILIKTSLTQEMGKGAIQILHLSVKVTIHLLLIYFQDMKTRKSVQPNRSFLLKAVKYYWILFVLKMSFLELPYYRQYRQCFTDTQVTWKLEF